MNKKDIKKGLIPYFFLLLIVLGVIYFYNISNKKINNLSYEQFKDGLDNSDITEVVITPRSSAGVYEIQGKFKDYAQNETFYLKVPLSEQFVAKLLEAEDSYDFNNSSRPWFKYFLTIFS